MTAPLPASRRIAAALARPIIAIVDGEHALDQVAPPVALGAFDGASANATTFFWVEGEEIAPFLSTGDAGADCSPAEARRLDQYYTQPMIARRYCGVLRRVLRERYGTTRFLMMEPSAGSGSFLGLMPCGSLGFDIAPRAGGIWHADFLKVQIRSARQIACLGNPPFGTNANLALAFFNHAAAQSRVVAFILPRTAMKHSFQNKLDRNFHLIHEEVVPSRAFLFCGRPYNVPAVFQIWERRRYERDLWPTETEHPDFEFLPDRKGADFALRRVGGRAGVVLPDLEGSRFSHLFIRAKVPGVRNAMVDLEPEFRAVAANVAGCPSIAKSEIVLMYSELMKRRLRARRRRVRTHLRRSPTPGSSSKPR